MALVDSLALALGYITLLSGQRQSQADARNDDGAKAKDGFHTCGVRRWPDLAGLKAGPTDGVDRTHAQDA